MHVMLSSIETLTDHQFHKLTDYLS